jgi:hypothetical protein
MIRFVLLLAALLLAAPAAAEDNAPPVTARSPSITTATVTVARVAAIKLRLGTRPVTIMVDETTGETYKLDTYRHVFAEVRALAIAGSAALGLAPCPSLAMRDAETPGLKHDQDLRDTGVTWLARADNTLPEICAISGHSLQSAQTVIKHYLGAYAALADSGIDKLVAGMAREGIAV